MRLTWQQVLTLLQDMAHMGLLKGLAQEFEPLTDEEVQEIEDEYSKDQSGSLS